jgi:hypothetical protein
MAIRKIHQCGCRACAAGDALKQAEHHQLNVLMSRLNEQQRRWLAGVEANRLGHGGTEELRRITGLDINTIRRGRMELASDLSECPSERIRMAGGGRKRLEKK